MKNFSLRLWHFQTSELHIRGHLSKKQLNISESKESRIEQLRCLISPHKMLTIIDFARGLKSMSWNQKRNKRNCWKQPKQLELRKRLSSHHEQNHFQILKICRKSLHRSSRLRRRNLSRLNQYHLSFRKRRFT